MTKFRQN